MVTIFSMCAFLWYWAGLYGDKADEVRGGANQLMRKVAEMARMTSTDARVSQPIVDESNLVVVVLPYQTHPYYCKFHYMHLC
jgi:hypothetical protein